MKPIQRLQEDNKKLGNIEKIKKEWENAPLNLLVTFKTFYRSFHQGYFDDIDTNYINYHLYKTENHTIFITHYKPYQKGHRVQIFEGNFEVGKKAIWQVVLSPIEYQNGNYILLKDSFWELINRISHHKIVTSIIPKEKIDAELNLL